MRLLVLQSDPFSGPGLMEAQWRLRGFELEFAYVHKGDPVPELDGADGLVVLGGRVMPDDDAPFLEPTRALLREAIDRGVPALAVCLGAELLCQATGGDVRELEVPSIGWQSLERCDGAEGDPLFGDIEDGDVMLGWHSFVLEPPPDAAVLLKCESGDVQAVRVGERAWGILDHPEQSLSVLGILLAENGEQAEEAGVDVDRLREESSRRQANSAAFGENLAHRFADQVLLR
jgi:GMP synthase-like glutamine amidotransferase